MSITTREVKMIFVAFFSLLLYTLYGFLQLSKLLRGFTKNIFILLIISTLNAYFALHIFSSTIPFLLTYPLGVLLLSAEFFLLSKAPLYQSVFWALLFILLCGMVQLPLLFITSLVLKINPYTIFLDKTMYYQHGTLLAGILFVCIFLFLQFFPVKIFKIISLHKSYSYMITIFSFIMLILLCVFSSLFFAKPLQIYVIFIGINIWFVIWILVIILFKFNIRLYNRGFLTDKNTKNVDIKKNENEHLSDLKKIIFIDNLTECYSRLYLEAYFNEHLRYKSAHYVLVYIDMDKLKFVNDTFGHSAGDMYIKTICKSINLVLRKNDIFVRLGGDEFVLLLRHCILPQALLIMNRIEEQLNTWNATRTEYAMSISYGVVYVDEKSKNRDLNVLLEIAEKNMRLAKQRGRKS